MFELITAFITFYQRSGLIWIFWTFTILSLLSWQIVKRLPSRKRKKRSKKNGF
jgi:hypothetical protein